MKFKNATKKKAEKVMDIIESNFEKEIGVNPKTNILMVDRYAMEKFNINLDIIDYVLTGMKNTFGETITEIQAEQYLFKCEKILKDKGVFI